MTPFRNRQVSHTAKTWCYRNLHRGGYSMVQDGVVVAHADDVTLVGVKFVVREAGRQRVLSEGVKNVHAFVVGKVPEMVLIDASANITWLKARYNPKRAAHFEVEMDGQWLPMEGASCVILGPTGMTVYNPTLLKIQEPVLVEAA
jgi:hypothetical protein